MSLELPKWHKDLGIYRDIKTAFIMEGNIHDYQAWIFPDGNVDHMPLNAYINRFLDGEGYEIIIFYNQIDGFHNHLSKKAVDKFNLIANTEAKAVETKHEETISFCKATKIMRTALETAKESVAIIFDMANTAIASPEALNEIELECLARLFMTTKKRSQAKGKKGGLLTNLLFFIVEKANDLPAWFYVNNPFIKSIIISKPEKELRKYFIADRIQMLEDYPNVSFDERNRAIDEMVNLTEGFSNADLYGIFQLCEKRKVKIGKIKEAINLFRYGEIERHWEKLNRPMIENAGEILAKRVKGQPNAINKVVDIISRACSGMTGIQSNPADRPKGVLFFAGPTGTGKTELAKAIAEMIFGDEKFVTRFDMSEYQQSHSDQRLLGAPPGYIGYGAGGQLTNAVKAKPFSVLLFDEIDKAHSSILDKFLQIIEDGRMTDSTGETVYFSETLIIFTSNLGLINQDSERGIRYQNVTMDMPFFEIQEKILSSIKNFFTFGIGRPELLNRIGDNFVIFDFIRNDVVKEILDGQIEKIKKNLVEEKDITLELAEEFYDALLKKAHDNIANGGRGIGNVVESILINPLSRVIVVEQPLRGTTIRIRGVSTEGRLNVDILNINTNIKK